MPEPENPPRRRWRHAIVLGAVALLVFALWRAAHLWWLGAGVGNDVYLYLMYAEAWRGGAVPYLGFQPEYPPGALPLFLLPLLYVGNPGVAGVAYVRAFALEMGIFDLGSYLLVLWWARRLCPDRLVPTCLMGGLYLVLTSALYPVIYTRFDLVPAALVAAALTLAYARPGKPALLVLSAIVLGVAAAVKLWPLALAPAWLLIAYRRGRWRPVVATGVGVFAGVALVFAPFALSAGWHVFGFLKYHAARGIEIGSTWASLALLLNLGGVYEAWTQHDFGAYHVKGVAAATYARWSTPLLPLGVLLPQVGAWFGNLGYVDRAADARGAEGARVTLATVLGFMVVGKVLSPQFSLWLVPLLPLVCRNLWLALVAIGIAVGTTIEYPFVAAALEMLAPGHTRAVLLVAARNALLVALFLYLCWRVGWGEAVARARVRWRQRRR